MDKFLVIKVLGKRDAVALDDEIFNLRNIVSDIQSTLILNIPIDIPYSTEKITKLNMALSPLTCIKSTLEDPNFVKVLYNSTDFLYKYIKSICHNITKVIEHLKTINIERLTHYTNILLDLVMQY